MTISMENATPFDSGNADHKGPAETGGTEVDSQRARIDERAMHLRACGMTFRRIAKELDITVSGAYQRVKRQLHRQRTLYTEEPGDSRDYLICLLESSVRPVAKQSRKGNLWAFALLMQYANLRTRLAEIPDPAMGIEPSLLAHLAATRFQHEDHPTEEDTKLRECAAELIDVGAGMEDAALPASHAANTTFLEGEDLLNSKLPGLRFRPIEASSNGVSAPVPATQPAADSASQSCELCCEQSCEHTCERSAEQQLQVISGTQLAPAAPPPMKIVNDNDRSGMSDASLTGHPIGQHPCVGKPDTLVMPSHLGAQWCDTATAGRFQHRR